MTQQRGRVGGRQAGRIEPMADSEPISAPVSQLLHELDSIFGVRLRLVAIYGGHGEAETLTGGGARDAEDHVHTLVESGQ
jgi:hypothetical protein